MEKAFPIINIALIAAIIALLGFSAKVWIDPPYPSRVDGDAVPASSKTHKNPGPLREEYPTALVDSVASENLFRQSRMEYIPPPPVPQTTTEPPKLALPPPKVTVKGTMLLKDKKIAVMEGTYSVGKGMSFEQKNLKRKGYELGEPIGTYKITEIDKDSVTLDNLQGSMVRANVDVRDPKKKIKRNGNLLYHKGKRLPTIMPVKKKKTRSSKKALATESSSEVKINRQAERPLSYIERVSGAKTRKSAPPRHISGR